MPQQRPRTQIISIGNLKGGVGKTTAAVHLAAALGKLGRKVLIIDLDSSTGATTALGLPAIYPGSFEMLIGDRSARDVIISNGHDNEVELPANVHIIVGSRDLDNLKSKLEKRSGSAPLQLKHELDSLDGEFDYCILDTAPATNEATTAAYLVSHFFVMVTRSEPLSIEGLEATFADIEAVQKLPYSALELLGVILTCVEGKQTKLGRDLTRKLETMFPRERGLFDTHLHRSIAIPKAQQQGKTLMQTDADHPVAREFTLLAKEFEQRLKNRRAKEK